MQLVAVSSSAAAPQRAFVVALSLELLVRLSSFSYSQQASVIEHTPCFKLDVATSTARLAVSSPCALSKLWHAN